MISGKIASVCVDMARYVCVCMCVYIQILLLPRDKNDTYSCPGFHTGFLAGEGGRCGGEMLCVLSHAHFLQPTLL